MPAFKVEVMRETWTTMTFTVEAEDQKAAEAKALNEASDTVWDKIPDADYKVLGTSPIR